MCQAPNSSPPKLYEPIDCPNHCKVYDFSDEEFEVQNNGTFVINTTEVQSCVCHFWNDLRYWKYLLIFKNFQNLKNLHQHNYCLSYECIDSEKWGIRASACLCPTQDELNKINKTIDSSIPRCCGSTPRYNTNCEKDTIDIVHLNAERCDEVISFTVDGSKIKFKDEEIPVDSSNICVGPTLGKAGLKMVLFNCNPPCNGKVPCIR